MLSTSNKVKLHFQIRELQYLSYQFGVDTRYRPPLMQTYARRCKKKMAQPKTLWMELLFIGLNNHLMFRIYLCKKISLFSLGI